MMETKSLLDALKQAMLSERDGYQFYLMAASQSNDPEAAKVFNHLAEEEQRHFQALQAKYRTLEETGTWDVSSALLAGDRLPVADRIFSDEFVHRIGAQHLEMAALSIGILLEKQSFEFYSRQADEAEDDDVAAFFRELASWEDEHYRMLLNQDEALKSDYWSENRFEPLL